MAAFQAPSNPPTPRDWDNHRHVITALYEAFPLESIVDGRETVVNTMWRDFRFKASERMFRQRIKEWQIGKRKKDSKARATCRVGRVQKPSHYGSTPSLRRRSDIGAFGRCSSFKRKRNRARGLISPHASHPPLSAAPMSEETEIHDQVDIASSAPLQLSSWDMFDPSSMCWTITPSPSIPREQLAPSYIQSRLSHFFEHYHLRSTVADSPKILFKGFKVDPYTIFDQCVLALACLDKPNAFDPWSRMRKFSMLVKPALIQQPIHCLAMVAALGIIPTLDIERNSIHSVLCLFASTSAELFGESHPITQFCRWVIFIFLSAETRGLLFRQLIAQFDEELRRAHESLPKSQIFAGKMYLCNGRWQFALRCLTGAREILEMEKPGQRGPNFDALCSITKAFFRLGILRDHQRTFELVWENLPAIL